MSAKSPGKGHTAKHTHRKVKHHKKTGKHHPVHHHKAATGGAGHHVHVVAKGAKHPVARGYAVGDLLPVCSLEAVAQWLRLEGGVRVTDDDVAMRWETLGELSIPAAAEAFGLSVRPAKGHSGLLLLGIDVPGPHAVLATPDGWWSWGSLCSPWPCRVEEAWLVSWGEVMPDVSYQTVLREQG